jgi:hypothetical protein
MQQQSYLQSLLTRIQVSRNTDWHWHETASGPVMRRCIGGEYEIRPLTPEELHEYEGSSQLARDDSDC